MVSSDTEAVPAVSYYLIWSFAQGYICQSAPDNPERPQLSGEVYRGKKKGKEKKIMTKKSSSKTATGHQVDVLSCLVGAHHENDLVIVIVRMCVLNRL